MKLSTISAVRPSYRIRLGQRTPIRSLLAGVLMIALSFVTMHAAYADEAAPEIEVAVSAEEIFVGETIDYQVEIRNVENPPAPDISALKELFDVVPNGNQSRNQSSTFIINGRVSQQNVLSHIYLYRLTPKATGDLTIPAARATVNGEEFSSRTISLRVQDAEKQDLVVVETTLDRVTVYPTQPFQVTLRVLVQPLPDNDNDPLRLLRRQPPHLQINWLDVPDGLSANQTSEWLQPLMSEDGTGFTINEVSASTGSIFGSARAAVFGLAKGRETRNSQDGTPINYFVYELSRTFTAEKTGTYTFGPAIVKGGFVGGLRDGEYLGKRLVAIAAAVNVDVREVPSPRPVSFTGGIGDYQVAASASPVKLRVGDPLTLTLEFARTSQAGSLELISAPDLTLIPEIAESFEIIDKAPTGRVEGELKKFAYAMRPKRPAVTLPALTLTTFDPTAETFQEIRTEPISLEVSEASALSSGELIGAVSAATNGDIRKSTAGIFQNITDPSELRDERISMTSWLAAAAGCWCLSLASIAGVTWQRRRSSDSAGLRRSNARREALAKLSAAEQSQSKGQSQEALQQIRAAFAGLVADTGNRVAEGLTSSDIEKALIDAGVTENDRTEIRELLQSIEDAQYGGGDSVNTVESLKTAATLIQRVSSPLERSGHR